MFLKIFGFVLLFGLVFFATTTVEKKPKLRPIWMLVGCIMFFSGSLSLIVNSVGLSLGFLQWVEGMGSLGAFLFKLGLIFGGISIVILVNHNPEAYDEYFDGKKYK